MNHISPFIFTGLMLIGCISPLCTFVRLLQLKEWRWDRLREHLRHEGWFRSIFGMLRPLLLIVWILILLPIAYQKIHFANFTDEQWYRFIQLVYTEEIIIILYAGANAAITFLQLLTKRQPIPVWTKKAIVIYGLSLISAAIIIDWGSFLHIVDWTPRIVVTMAVPLLMPFICGAILIILSPLDRYLKYKIMQQAARLRSNHAHLCVIGITGSVGKTTTKELLRHILSDRGAVATPLHLNSEMGVAQWLISVLQYEPTDSRRTLIVEMGAYRKGEIRNLCRIARPTIGVVTFVGNQHLALFGSQENLCQAKRELIESLPKNGHAFLNGDNPQSATFSMHAPCPVTVVSTGGRADLEAFDIEETGSGVQFRVEETLFHVPLHGTHNIINLLLAIAVARHCGMPLPDIARALLSFRPLPQTFSISVINSVTVLNDTHNSSLSSFTAAIQWARSQKFPQKILLVSGLIELGKEQDNVHTMLGSSCNGVFDRVIFLNKRSAQAFRKGYQAPVEPLNANTTCIANGALLVCLGRMSPSTIQALLP